MIDGNLFSFVDHISSAAILCSTDGTLRKMNEGYRMLFGVTLPETVVGRYNVLRDGLLARSLRPGEDLAPVFSGKALLSSFIQYPLGEADPAFGLQKKDVLLLELVAFPMWSDRGEAAGVIVSFKDVSERRKKELQLLESEKRYRTLMEALPDMLFCVAPDQTVLFVNGFSARQFHTTPEKLAGKKISELFPPANFERMWRNIELVYETGEPRYTENKTFFNEKSYWLDTWLVPLCDSQGSVYAVMGVSRDITEKMKYKEELEKTRNLESLGTLAGGIAHDFNNILAAVQGNLSLLKELCAERSEQSELIVQASRAMDRARSLTGQLLTFSKGGAPIRQQASLRDLIMDSTGFVAHGTAVRAEFSFPDDLWPCELDSGQISQVIQNLVSNAVQAMPGGGTVKVAVRNAELPKGHPSGCAGRFVMISVQDHGSGIPEENMGKVFVPFFSTKAAGRGLGLPICYSIIKQHDGFMSIESRPGEGTLVSFSLPVRESPAADDGPGPGKSKGGKRVLVIDDEAFVRFTFEKCLLHLGCRPSMAADGEEGSRLFRQAVEGGNPFEAVILDLTIPGSAGGSEILAELKKIDPDVKAIVSSGYSNSPVLADPGAFGFKAVLAKPFALRDLEGALDKVL